MPLIVGNDKANLLSLASKAKTGELVYFISNTNELSVFRFLQLLTQTLPELKMDEIDISPKESRDPIQILPGMFLCLSYQYCIFKADGQALGEPKGMIEILIGDLKGQDQGQITLISQYNEDLQTAKKLEINAIHAHQYDWSIRDAPRPI